jgi:hypothetical protein
MWDNSIWQPRLPELTGCQIADCYLATPTKDKIRPQKAVFAIFRAVFHVQKMFFEGGEVSE